MLFCRVFGHKFEETRPYTAPNVMFCIRGGCPAWHLVGHKDIHETMENEL